MFLGLSQYTWEILFQILEFVMLAVAAGYVTVVVIKKYEIKNEIVGEQYERSINAYVQIHELCVRLRQIEALPRLEQGKIAELLAPLDFKTEKNGVEYVSFFHDISSFEEYYQKRFNQKVRQLKNYLDECLTDKLSEFQNWLEDIHKVLQLFANVEKDKSWHFDSDTVEKHNTLLVRSLGVALQNDIENFYDDIDKLLRRRLEKVDLSHLTTSSIRFKIKKKISGFCEKKFETKSNHGILKWIYLNLLYPTYGRSQLHTHNGMLFLLMTMLHYSEVKQPKEFFDESSEEEEMKMIEHYRQFVERYQKDRCRTTC